MDSNRRSWERSPTAYFIRGRESPTVSTAQAILPATVSIEPTK
jgi:hypothetical protein